MAPKRAAALTPKAEAAPVFSTGGVALEGEAEEPSLLVALGEPVEMVLLAPWLGTMEAEAEAAEVTSEVLTVVDTSVEEAADEALVSEAEAEALVE